MNKLQKKDRRSIPTVPFAVFPDRGGDVEAHVRAELLAGGVRVDGGVVLAHGLVERGHEGAEALLLGARVVAHVVADHHQRLQRDRHRPRRSAQLPAYTCDE